MRWVLGAALGLVGLMCVQRIRDVDCWWQWTLGKAIVEGGPWAVTTEQFMLTREGVPTHTLSWGYCVGLYLTQRAIGATGLVVVKMAMVVGTFAIMAAIARRRASVVETACAVVVCGLVASQRMVMRPEVVTYLLLAIVLWVIDTAGARKTRWVWVLPAVQLVWVNVHSTFVIGLGVIGVWVGLAAAVEARARFRGERVDERTRWSVRTGFAVGALSVLASMASPYLGQAVRTPYRRMLAVLPDPSWRAGVALGAVGVVVILVAAYLLAGRAGRWWRGLGERGPRVARALRLPALVAALVGAAMIGGAVEGWRVRGGGSDVEREAITELASPWELGSWLTAVWWYRIAVVVVAGTVLARWPRWMRSRRELLWVIVTGAMLALSSLAVRGLGLFGVVSVVMVAVGVRSAAAWVRSASPVMAPRLALSGAVLVVALCGYYAHAVVTDRFWVRQGDSGRFGFGVDERATPRLAASVLLAAERDGTRVRMFNSERTGGYLMSRGLRVFIDSRAVGNILPEYLKLLRDPSGFDAVSRKYGLNAAVVDVLNRPLVAQVSHLPNWRLVHLDEQAAVFFRGRFAMSTDTVKPEVESERLLADMRVRLGGRPERTPRLWERAVCISGHVSAAWVLWDLGAVGAARGLLEDAAVLDPARFGEWVLLGQARELKGDVGAAAAAYERAIERSSPEVDWLTLCMAASAHLRSGDLERADSRARWAVDVAPEKDEPWELGLATAEKRGDAAGAAWWKARRGRNAENGVGDRGGR